MNITELAKEAGLLADDEAWVSPHQEAMERFAALVAAHEREACAKVCDLVAREIDDTNGTATYCAKAIRAEALAEPVKQEPAAMLFGIGEDEPMLTWYTPWLKFPIGTKFYAAPVSEPEQETVAWVNAERNTITWEKIYPNMEPLYAAPVDSKAIRAEALEEAAKFAAKFMEDAEGVSYGIDRAIRGLK
jgi:hypothetical protein